MSEGIGSNFIKHDLSRNNMEGLVKGRWIYRKADEVYRLWLCPYENESGDYVDSHYVYFVIKHDKWEREIK